MNFGNGVAEIQRKYEGEREKVGERKFSILVITLLKFLLPKLADWVGVKCSKCEALKGKPIMAMPLPKQGGKKICGNCGIAIAENGRKKKIVVAEITCEELKKKKCYVYNIFTTFSQKITCD